MNADNYNKYLRAVKAANDIRDDDLCRATLRNIYADMCRNPEAGPSDSDVEYFVNRVFRLYI